MKKLFILFPALFVGVSIFAQSIVVSFTGKNINNNYVQIDSVVVIDLTNSWSVKLTYPDTTLDLSTVGINNYENQQNEFALSQNIPNPFNGVTDFSLSIGKKKMLLLKYVIYSERKSLIIIRFWNLEIMFLLSVWIFLKCIC